MISRITINPELTALVIIDLQKGIVSMPTEPIPVQQVLKNANDLIRTFHIHSSLVIFVRVAYSPDGKDMLKLDVDEQTWGRNVNLQADWSEIVPELERLECDLMVTKRQWGAFYGTDLDMELRRRNIKTIILCGIATNYGVESTARDAYERGYNLIFAEDAMASRAKEDHEFSIKRIFPRIGRVRKTEGIINAFQ